jgi:hypothetical protein
MDLLKGPRSSDPPKTVAGDGTAAVPKMFCTLGKLLEGAGAVEKLKLEPVFEPAQ